MHFYKILFILIVFSSIFVAADGQVDTLSLNDGWTFREGTTASWYPALVPGTVQEDLIRLGQLPDPFIGTNEDSLVWVENKDWVYQTEFNLSTEQLEKKYHTLIFHGMDTYAEVFLNGNRILVADNMFRKWEVQVSDWLKPQNKLKIYFHSPIKKGQAYLDKLPYQLPTDNDAGEIKVAPVVRKAAFHFGWDWGPRIVTCGIWRPVELLSYDGARIKDMLVHDDIHYGVFEANEHTHDSLVGRSYARVTADVHLEGNPFYSFINTYDDIFHWSSGSDSITQIHFTIVDPEYWWPNGLGQQKLYTLRCQLGETGHSAISKKIGLRKAELIHQPDSLGTSFYFKINGRPIFAKGANYIPQRHFTNSLTRKDYRDLLTTAAESNMNMIRVWGGGIYEEDYFYELCDSLGLMVWQDFMFANTIYPADEAFTDNILAEVRDNIQRLSHHPSIVHWCGNNEIDVAWHNWGWQKKYELKEKHQKILYDNYTKLFNTEIPEILYAELPSANYSHTSPLSNWGRQENYNHGSMHYWGVFHGEDPFEDYGKNIGRFNSEYGFQSFPNINVIEDFFHPKSFDLEDPLLAHRQKSYKGNRLIYKHLADYYPEPTSLLELSYLSQLAQAKGISMAIRAHRLDQPRCMGTLYWQLNDCWPAVSWSSLDYNGQWRALHYRVKEAYAPIACIVDMSKGKTELVFLNELLATEKLNYTILTLKGEMLEQGELVVSSMDRISIDISHLISDLSAVHIKMIHSGVESSQIHWIDQELELEEPMIEMNLEQSLLRVSSKKLVKDLYLYSEDGYIFSSNFFDLLPGSTKEIKLSHPETKSFDISKIRYISYNNIHMRKKVKINK